MGAETVPVGPSGAAPAVEAAAQAAAPPELTGRAAKIAAFKAGVAANTADAPADPAPAKVDTAADPAVKAPVADAPDPQTAKGIEAIEKRDARARKELADERAKWKTERDLEVAELARLRADASKEKPLAELKALPLKDRYRAALKQVGIDPDDEDHMEVVARDTYARSKSGKADPKNKAYADQVAEKQGLTAELAELRKMVEETREQFTTRDQRAALEQVQTKYLDDAVKAVPGEPSHIGLALKANPAKARASLLALGQRMEREAMEADGASKYDPSYTPTHAQVIAKYELEQQSDLKDRGFTDEQIASLLKPAAAPKPAPPKTLDVTAVSGTRPINGNPTRDQKIAAARAGLKRLNAETTT